MLLYANGCSHTAGTKASMDGDMDMVYPYLIGKEIGYDVYSDASEGSSIDRIVRTTVDFITSTAIPPDMVIIQFPNPYRFESPEDHYHLPTSHIKRVERQDLKEDSEYLFYKNYIVKDRNNNIYYELKAIREMYFLQLLFEEFGIDNYIFSFFNYIQHKEEIRNYSTYKNLNKSKVLFGDKLLNISGELLHNKFKRHKDDHFMKDAHEQIAKWHIEHYRRIPHNNITLNPIQEDDRVYRYD